MAKFSTDYINLIAANLRDRYKSGFPILKELVQNADDAGATELAFGYHAGLANSADHLLLQGPALWVLNNGRFLPSDREAIHSFGLNGKAAESGAIGKFGLGMKSVFHLCESFFYVAHDGHQVYREILNPWLQDSGSTSMHEQWEAITERDLACLKAVADSQAEVKPEATWFMLWVPLRTHAHIAIDDGRKVAAIIDRYPGESDGQDLDFFTEPGIDQRIGTLLPLLRHLEQVRFCGAPSLLPFCVRLKMTVGCTRLDHETNGIQMDGIVCDDRPSNEHLRFLAKQYAPEKIESLALLLDAPSWPKSMAILPDGKRGQVPDKARPEGAVLLGHADKRQGRLVLQWAVFLPTEELRFSYEARIPNSSREYRIFLHGQFFVDAGRRGIEDMDVLHQPHEPLPANAPQSMVLRCWNQVLAQEVVLPHLLESLSEYVKVHGLKDDEIRALTLALQDCAAIGDAGLGVPFFSSFRRHVCLHHGWVRKLERTGPCWTLVAPAAQRVLRLPPPANRDFERPWRTLPGLAGFKDTVFIDSSAPNLVDALDNWDATLLLSALGEVSAQTLKSETDLEYLVQFLEMESQRELQTSRVQDEIVSTLRKTLQNIALTDVRRNRSLFKMLVSLLPPDRRFGLGTRDTSAKGAMPELAYRALVARPTRALLLPGDLAPDKSPGVASDSDLNEWLQTIARLIVTPLTGEDTNSESLLDVADNLIKAAGEQPEQAALLRRNTSLRVLKSIDGRNGKIIATSLAELVMVHRGCLLFKVSNPNKPLGLVHDLSLALPDVKALIVRAPIAQFVQSVGEAGVLNVPSHEDALAVLRAVSSAHAAPTLGNIEARRKLLALAGNVDLTDPEIVQGLRYLLHGSKEHYRDSQILWKDPSSQHSPWVKLWRMVSDTSWNVLTNDLCASIPDKCSKALNIRTVDEGSVINRLRVCNDFARVKAEEFSTEDRDAILGRVVDENVWRQLPLHRDSQGGFGHVDGSCHLGFIPSLPYGIEHGQRFIEHSGDEVHQRNQTRWIPNWTSFAAARIVLRSPQPTQYWRFLLDQISIDDELKYRPFPEWKTIAWLPLKNGQGIALDSLICLKGLQPEIAKLANQCGYAFAGLDDLEYEVQRHPGFPYLAAQVASGDRALPVLGQMMSATNLSIGRSFAKLPDGGSKYRGILSRLTSLPAWGMLEKASDVTSEEAVSTHLMPEVASQLSAEQVQCVLDELQHMGSDFNVRELYALYLQELRLSENASDTRSRLRSMSLLSAAGTWQLAVNLVYGVAGVEKSQSLDETVANVLRDVITTNIDTPQGIAVSDPTDVIGWDGATLVRELETAFEPLACSSVQPAAGAVIGLFGQAVTALAKSWLGSIAYEDYLNCLGWKDPGYEDGPDRRLRWMGGKSVEQALLVLKPTLKIVAGDTVSVLSILDDPIKVTLLPVSQAATLLAGKMWWQAGNGVIVSLRPPETLLDYDLDEQKSILQRTAEEMLALLYNQPHANLSALWGLFEKADQVTLDVARGLILDGLPQLLRQLGRASKGAKISVALAAMDSARRDFASAKQARRSTVGPQDSIDKALLHLVQLVETDCEVQEALLSGIRERVAHNQYEVASIPFEIFQNADDAVSEFQQLQQAEERATFDPMTIGRFLMQCGDRMVRFMHWGRPINYAGRYAGYRPDFSNDLERMLMLGASSKDDEEDVTGKFGLGFKSVLLATDKPRVWSGDLCFEVIAGCLPQRWQVSAATRQFYREQQATSVLGLRGTLIELPLESRETQVDLAKRFIALAGLATVFSRHIKRIQIGEESHVWSPKLILEAGVGRVETALVQLPTATGHSQSRLLVLRSQDAAIALRMDATGVIAFDDGAKPAVPAVWVTAPTRGPAAKGMVINAGFQIDTGRASLALGRAALRNRELARSIADDLVASVVALQLRVENDWRALSAELGCSTQTSGASFWFSFWNNLFGDEPSDEAAEDLHLINDFVVRLFQRSVEKRDRIANGMVGEASGFVKLDQLCLVVKLDRLGDTLPALQAWPAFLALYPCEGWCAEEVSNWLRRSGACNEPQPLPELDRTIVMKALSDDQLSLEAIEHLSKVIFSWPKGLMEDYGWREVLRSTTIRTRSAAWHAITNVLHGNVQNLDLLHQFAPDSALLDTAYERNSPAWEVIHGYLPSFQIDWTNFASWCLSASGGGAQSAAVHWLLRNQYSPVMELIRRRSYEGGWIFGLSMEHEALQDLPHEDRCSLLAKLGLSADDAQAGEFAAEVLDLPTIHRWWQQERDRRLPDYESNLWPAHVDRRLLADEPFNRTAWMTLFALAIFRRYGRVTDEQHRGFLVFLHTHGWWETVCHVDPDAVPQAWMDILREYGEAQMTTPLFEQWMDSFPRLYRVARWLDVYVQIFQTIDMRSADQVAELLSPSMDASLTGSGIEAPTLSGMLRLGQNLVIRELLRVNVLNTGVAESFAYMPRSSVLTLMAQMGFEGLQTSQEIYEVLVGELGEENARFNGDYDIPLQLLATSPQLQQEVLAWARNEQWYGDEEESLIDEELQ
ncbi:MAG TPA: hypothetical protein VJ577_08730 [Burkholderiaceae bacterium]|nr:hypothetical protein [Burkholderiaceae bacterium]